MTLRFRPAAQFDDHGGESGDSSSPDDEDNSGKGSGKGGDD
jgi:hypothetical protein